jgi:hypothetical protein
VSYNWQNKLNGTANLSYLSGEKTKIDLSMGYTRSKTRSSSGTQPMPTYLIWGCPNSSCVFPGLRPEDDGRGYLAGVVPEDFKEIEGYDNIDRGRLGLTITNRPISWLNHRFTLGGDFTNNASSDFFPRGSNINFGFPQGIKFVAEDGSSFVTADYSATGTARLGSSLESQSSVGAQYYHKRFTQISGQGEGFPMRAVNTVSGGGQRQGFEDPELQPREQDVGLYVQEQLAWKDRLFLIAAVAGTTTVRSASTTTSSSTRSSAPRGSCPTSRSSPRTRRCSPRSSSEALGARRASSLTRSRRCRRTGRPWDPAARRP